MSRYLSFEFCSAAVNGGEAVVRELVDRPRIGRGDQSPSSICGSRVEWRDRERERGRDGARERERERERGRKVNSNQKIPQSAKT